MPEHFSTYRSQQKPFISFIITYYNQPANMLKECLESILDLPLPADEREIIIIDDGSTQSPIDDIKDFQQEIIYLRQPNQGVSLARNKGMELARGEYLQLVDADDKLVAATYARCLDWVRQQEEDQCPDVFMFRYTCQDSPATADGEAMPMLSGPTYMRTSNVRGSACCVFFRKAILGTLRFHPHVSYGEDEEFITLLLLRAERVCDSSFKAYYYRQYAVSATHQNHAEAISRRLDDTHAVICRLHAQEDNWPPEEREALRRKVAQLTMDYLYNMMRMTHDNDEVEKRIQELTGEGLFPLPDNRYTKKYTVFSRMVNNPLTRKVLQTSLKLLK